LRFFSVIQTKQKLCFDADRARETKVLKTMSAVAVILIVHCLVPSLEAKDIIRDKSPDGKFALRITKEEDGGWEAAIIDLKKKVDAVGLELYQRGFIEQAHLVWSKDSQRVAYFEPDRRGGNTTVYFRKGSKFEEVSLPFGDTPECDEKPAKNGDSYLKTIEASTRPLRWLRAGELVVEEHSEALMENGATQSCGQTITIAFDSDHKASVQSVKQDK